MAELLFIIVGVLVALYVLYIVAQKSKSSSNNNNNNNTTTTTTKSSRKRNNRQNQRNNNVKFQTNLDKYESIEEVQEMLRKSGLESCNLILAIDYTKSNEYNGRRTFGGHSLHAMNTGVPNPYQQSIHIIGRTLEIFDEDRLIPCYGFGDITTKDRGVFPFFPNGAPCRGFDEVLTRYTEITPGVQLSGPTSFAPAIHEAIKIVRQNNEYHILVIVADGQVTNEKSTVDAIVEASHYPLSIIVVGVGDGPWDTMNNFDDNLPQRQFDNFQFVDFHKTVNVPHPEPAFALSALMEIPDQFIAIRKLNLLGVH